MNLLDIVILLLLIVGAIRGFFNGFISELASILSLIIGIWAAFHFADDVFVILSKYIDEPGNGTQILSYLIVFIGVAIIMLVISNIITKIIGFLALGFINKILGLFFGAAKTLLLLLLLAYLLKPLLLSDWIREYETVSQSQVLPILLSYTELIGDFIQLDQDSPQESDIII